MEKYKYPTESDKKFELRVKYYVIKMKREFDFEYSEGDFVRQHELLLTYSHFPDYLLIHASKEGILPLVIHSLNKGADINANDNNAIILAQLYEREDIIQYLKMIQKFVLI